MYDSNLFVYLSIKCLTKLIEKFKYMSTDAEKIELRQWTLLAKATGYTANYCYQVLTGRRSRKSKGGKKIMRKYGELKKLVENE